MTNLAICAAIAMAREALVEQPVCMPFLAGLTFTASVINDDTNIAIFFSIQPGQQWTRLASVLVQTAIKHSASVQQPKSQRNLYYWGDAT